MMHNLKRLLGVVEYSILKGPSINYNDQLYQHKTTIHRSEIVRILGLLLGVKSE